MYTTLTSILKIILTLLSLYLADLQFKNDNNKLGVYWAFVTLYWFFNFLSGLKI